MTNVDVIKGYGVNVYDFQYTLKDTFHLNKEFILDVWYDEFNNQLSELADLHESSGVKVGEFVYSGVLALYFPNVSVIQSKDTGSYTVEKANEFLIELFYNAFTASLSIYFADNKADLVTLKKVFPYFKVDIENYVSENAKQLEYIEVV